MKKRNLIKDKRGVSKIIFGIFSLVILILLVMFVSSQNQTLEDELNSLENELSNNGYGWLVNYSINYSEVNESVGGGVRKGIEFDWVVDPPEFPYANVSNCQYLDSANTYYVLNISVLNDTITGNCIVITAQNITLDCDGYSIKSIKNYSGIYSNQYNTTIKNCNISMGSDGNSNAIGITMGDNADYSYVFNNTIVGEMRYGILFSISDNGPDNSLIENNTVNVSAVNSAGSAILTDGIYLFNSSNNTLRWNNATTLGGYGIYIGYSSNNTLINSAGTSNSSYGIVLGDSSNSTLISNTGISNSLYGIYLSSSSNNTLINSAGTSNSGSGIFLYSSSNNTLISNTGISNSLYGIYLSFSSSNNILTSNTGTSNSSYGIFLYSSSNSTLINNTGTSNSSYGIFLYSSSNSTLINNTGTSNSNYTVYLYNSNNNVLNNLRAEGSSSGSRGIVFRNSSNTIIRDCVNVSGFSGDVYYYSVTSYNNTFINCSYRISGDNESVLSGGSLIRKWYYRAYVNDSDGMAISGANVSAWNVSGILEFGSLMTGIDGFTNITEITDYVNNGTARIYYSNYTINFSRFGYENVSRIYNVTAINGTEGVNNNLNYNVQLNYSVAINLWICNTPQRFDNASCWSQLRIPGPGDNVVFNGSGTGNCNITNNTMPQNLNSFTVESSYTGTIQFLPLFAKGDWTGRNDGTQLWNVTNNIVINGGTMKIWGDFRLNDTYGIEGNITADGHGQEWRSVNGNITIGSGAVLDGEGLGFPMGVGPGYGGENTGGTHGGRGAVNGKNVYGNPIEPTSLGSGSRDTNGGGAIKIQASNLIVNGNISVVGTYSYRGSAGGSIWIIADSFSGSGVLNAGGGNGTYAGGGGRIALNPIGTLNFTGIIENKGGINSNALSYSGSGGTVYINASQVYMTGATISVAGYNGSTGGSDWGQRINITSNYMKLSGVYNVSEINKSNSATVDGTITLNWSDCSSDVTQGIYDPGFIDASSCSYGSTNVWICTSGNHLWNNASCWSLGRVPASGDNVVFNSSGLANCNITNNTLPQNLNSFTVESNYTGTIQFLPLFAKGDWTGRNDGTQLWNVTNNIVINGGTMKIWGDFRLNDTYGIEGNITADGHGQEWRSVSGNITIGSSANLDGEGLGFPLGVGPGYCGSYCNSFHAGLFSYAYGNATAPTSLGSGGSRSRGASAIKLTAANFILVNGNISMPGTNYDWTGQGSGGSIWLKAINISGNGSLNAGVVGSVCCAIGNAGRIRLEYGNSLEFSGVISLTGPVVSGNDHFKGAGTLTFTNNTWPGNWTLTGNIGLLGGDYGEGNVTNVLGNFNTNGYNITIYGDCFANSGNYKAFVCYNKTYDGRGVWINASGDIIVTSQSVLKGYGFSDIGPGYEDYNGGTHGGRGSRNSKSPYGSEVAPVSLGSGTNRGPYGGGAIKLQGSQVFVWGRLDMYGAGGDVGGSGGSILLVANNFSGNGEINTYGGRSSTSYNRAGGGGRIAIYSSFINFSGIINNKGGNGFNNISIYYGSGGTVYINASQVYLTGARIDVAGYNGSTGGSDWGQRINITANYMKLSGVYNVSEINKSNSATFDGTITLNWSDCTSDVTQGIYDPDFIDAGSCGYGSTNVWICTSGNYNWNNASCWSLGRVPASGDNVVFNGSGTGNCNITNNTMPQNLNSFTVESSYTGTIQFLPLFAKGDWTGRNDGTQLWNVTNNIVINGGTMKIWGDFRLNDTYGVYGNITADGHGQEWRSVNGNITIGAGAVLDGDGLGFPAYTGPAYPGGHVASYGNATAPTSLGSGGNYDVRNSGGSGIKLHAVDLILVNGNITISGKGFGWTGGAGGSIWLKANNISGNGVMKAEGWGSQSSSEAGASGGRIRLEYGASLEYSGFISLNSGGNVLSRNLGTLTFTNNTWPGNWTLTGNIGLLGGDYGEGNVINVLGNFNTNDYNITIYGDCFRGNGSYIPFVCYNKTYDGRGVWINASGDINISRGSILDGNAFGFPPGVGPGRIGNNAASHGGRGTRTNPVYGNERAPVSLGTGANINGWGGSAIKLETNHNLIINGKIGAKGIYYSYFGPAGGSIWLKGGNISGSGALYADGGAGAGGNWPAGGGGRIALTSAGLVNFTGIIFNRGGSGPLLSDYGSGGTVYINASQIYLTGAVIDVAGYNGSTGGSDWGQRINITADYMKLSGVYNASEINKSNAATVDGTITLNWSDCGSEVSTGIYDPHPPIVQTACNGGAASMCKELNETGMIYTLMNNVTSNSTCFNITANNVTIDCRGYMIKYSANGIFGYGVYSNRNYSNVRNCDISGFFSSWNSEGIMFVNSANSVIFNNKLAAKNNVIHLSNSSNINISNNTFPSSQGGDWGYHIALYDSNYTFISSNTHYPAGYKRGIYFYGSNSNILSNNLINISNAMNIYCQLSQNNSIYNNNVVAPTLPYSSTGTRMFLDKCSFNNISNNNFSSISGISIEISGSESSHFNNTITPDNLAEGKPINYTFNGQNIVIRDNDSFGQVICAWCSNVTYDNITVYQGDGISLFNSSNSRIINSNITTSKGHGIYLAYNSSFNNLTNNKIRIYGDIRFCKGVYLYLSSDDNYLFNNHVYGGSGCGNAVLLISKSSRNIIENSNFTSFSDTGCSSDSGAFYIEDNSFDNIIKNSSISNSLYPSIYIDTGKVNASVEDSVLTSGINYNNTQTGTSLSAGSQIVFLNVSFNKSKVGIRDSDFVLFNKYYFDVNISNSSGSSLSGVNVTGYYNNGTGVFSLLTGSNGRIVTQNLTEYYQNSSGIYYLTPYNFTSFLTSYRVNYSTVNFTNNYMLNITLNSSSQSGVFGTSLGFVTKKIWVNYNENVSLNLTIPLDSHEGYTLDKVWATVGLPNGTKVNRSMSNTSQELFNVTYVNTGLLGDYYVTYYANATTGELLFENIYSNFSVQNTSIIINAPSDANTTDTINMNGWIGRWNGTSFWNIANNLFLIKLNNVTVSSSVLNHSNFSDGGSGTNVNISSVVQLNLSNVGNVTSYSDDYSTTKYTNDAYEVNTSTVGYDGARGVIFSYNHLTTPIGNITYRFVSLTKFFNATVYVKTGGSETGGGANTSVWYSVNGVDWYALNSTTQNNFVMKSNVPVNNYGVFFIRMLSDTNSLSVETPVTEFAVNYTSYEYPESGNYLSPSIYLPNVTYTVLKWDRVLNGGEIKIQLRESDDNSSWSEWSNNYTNHLTNDISSFTKSYLQYRAWLSTSNSSSTPVLYDVQILYFNASTNSSGGYDYNITIPTNALGPLPLEVSIVQNPETGIVGLNRTTIVVWARTEPQYTYSPNYTNPSQMTNYSVYVNFTRADIGELVNGTVKVNVSNSSYSSTKTCDGSQCVLSWLIPGELAFGNYTINISLSNVSAYYINSTTGYKDYLEERNTTGSFFVPNKTVPDYNPSADYYFYINATVNNTGKASMNNIHVWAADKHQSIKNVSEITPCSRLYPGYSCNALMLVVISSGASTGNKYITWRMNWSDNDGSVAGGSGYLQHVSYVIISLNANMSISKTSVNKTIQHESSGNFSFYVNSTGTDDVVFINLTFKNYTLPQSWITISPNWIAGLAGGQSQEVFVYIDVPKQTAPGNYSGIVNVSSANAGERYLNLTVTVPLNSSWYLVESNLTYNKSFSLNIPGWFGNYTIVNIGNINLTFNLTYSPGRTTDYTLKPGLFTINNSDGTNPITLNVEKGKNGTIILYQNGWEGESLDDVGVIVKIYNETAVPTTEHFEEAFWIAEQPPNVTNIYFILDGNYGDIAELNKNLTIKVRATDDVNLNETATKINITYGSTTITLNASSFCGVFGECVGPSGARVVVNFSTNFTPYLPMTHSVKAIVYDTKAPSGQSYVSQSYTFNVYSTTTMNFGANVSSVVIRNVDLANKESFYVNFSVNNTGVVYGYSASINFTKNASIVVNNISVGDVPAGHNRSYIGQVNVSQLTPPGRYNLTAVLRWLNPDGSVSTSSVIIEINVSSNKSFSYQPSALELSFNSNSQNSTILTINNTGNDVLTGMNLNCYSGTACSSLGISYNETNFNVNPNSTKNINVTVTTYPTTAGGSYSGIINISEVNLSKTVNLFVSVAENYSFSVYPTSVEAIRAVSQSGTLSEITVNNTGNMELLVLLTSTNSSIIQPNVSSLIVPIASARKFMINYTAPSEEGTYSEKIMVTNYSAIPFRINVSVNLTVTRVNVTILSPTPSAPLTNVLAGQEIQIYANASYGNEIIGSNATWDVQVGGTSCSNVYYEFVSQNGYWFINCSAPNIADGRSYDLSLMFNHTTYGQVVQTSANSIIYKDISVPVFVNVTRNNINKSQNINLKINVTDNVNISRVSFVLTYPNLSVYSVNGSSSINMSLSNGFYVFTDLVLEEPGEYTVNYSAVDTSGNSNSTSDWFEVYDRYYWNVKLLDYSSAPVSGVNVSLRRINDSFVLLSNITNSSGDLSLYINRRFYDIFTTILSDTVLVKNVNFTNLAQQGIYFNLHRVAPDELAEMVQLHRTFQGVASNSTNLSNEVVVTFNYSGLNYDNSNKLGIVKCSNWNYSSRSCKGDWSVVSSSINKDAKIVSGNSSGFSAYFLAENKCGNGACEASYGETTSTCSDDCKQTEITVPGGGGGGGTVTIQQNVSLKDLTGLEDVLKNLVRVEGVKVDTSSIYKEMFAGETATVRIKLTNELAASTKVSLSVVGDVKSMLFFETTEVALKPSESRSVLIKITTPKTIEPGFYEGDIILKSGKKEASIPVTIRILSPEGKLLDVKIQPLVERVAPGEILRIQTDLLNLGKTSRVDVQFDLQLIDINTGEVVTRREEAFAVEARISTIKNLTIPEYIIPGKYMIKATAYYSNPEQENMQATSIAYITVGYPFYKKQVLGVPIWAYLIIALVFALIVGVYVYIGYQEYKKRRFKISVDLSKLPQPSVHSAFIGKIAETGIRAFVDLNKLQMHTLIAGATGGGKTVAAQDIVESALLHNKSVIVFDPTAQWTGFLRKCDDRAMLRRYQYFDMKIGDAKGFNGTIKTIKDPYELIDIGKYMNRKGEITIFNISNLTPKEIDIVVASTIQQIFRMSPEESRELKTLIVYDEVHRLLPKFGGSGEGFIQLERGVREFRKWGIGLVLISQVLSDFIGEVKANIGTEIQMGTRYEGDLERINMKYGEDVLKSVVKAPIGSGMIVNAEYNSGKPYFVSFRPLLHNTKRLLNEELKKYEEYFEEIEDLEYQAEKLKELGVDVLDLELELKLAKGKIKEGQFQMADMYLEGLRPRTQEYWMNLGKKPMHLVKEKISKSEVEEAIEKAKKEREKYIKENPEKELSFDEDIKEIEKELEEKKKNGKKTSVLEEKIKDLKKRLEPFKGKVSEKDAEGVREEISSLKKEMEKL